MATNSYVFNVSGLSAEEQVKFDTVYNDLKSRRQSYVEYKRNLRPNSTFDEEEGENEWRHELHRFLRARKWNVAHTIKSLLEMIQWRIDHHVDSILDDPKPRQRMDYFRTIVPSAYHGHSKARRPIYIEKTGQVNVDEVLNQFSAEELIQLHIYWLELSCQLAREHSRTIGQHVDSFVSIYDLNGMKMDIRKLINSAKQCLFIDDNYYPERLGQLFVVNPPSVFPAIWNMLKHFIDPVTKRKIMVMKKGNETATALLEYIESDQLPSEYGGSCRSCPTAPDCVPSQRRQKHT